MKTPEEYKRNLKNKIITEDMLVHALFSVNKRAKNCRDKARKYRKTYRYSRYDESAGYEAKRDYYYALKEKLLSVVPPTCIHAEATGRYPKKRIYSYQKGYRRVKEKDILYVNYYWDDDQCQYVEFVDVINGPEIIQYYLFHDFGDYSFHTPIQKENIEKYSLDIVEISEIKTKGKDVQELLSVQFVKQMLALIESGNYQYIKSA